MRNETRNVPGDPPIPPVGHETGDIPYRVIVYVGISIMVLLLLVVFGLRVFVDWKSVRLGGKLKFMKESTFQLEPELQGSKPLLQADAAGDTRRIRAEEEHTLHSYGWLDRQGGKVRIPIEQAMQEVLRQGLPTRAEAGETVTNNPKPGTSKRGGRR